MPRAALLYTSQPLKQASCFHKNETSVKRVQALFRFLLGGRNRTLARAEKLF